MSKNFKKSIQYKKRVHKYIVGGAHTYSKGDDQFPKLSPAAISHGKGAHIWDIDNNKYIDCALGLGSVSIGHSEPEINKEIIKEVKKGTNFQRPSYIELETARKLLSILPGMNLVKFAKNGSSVTTGAVKLSRAYTGRKIIAFPKDHPFYSYDDWFISHKKNNSGIPEEIKNLSITYDSQDPETLANVFKKYKNKIACVITEPENLKPLKKECIIEVEKITKRNKAIFIIDEMLSGYRADFPGSYTKIGLNPDLTTWGKAIGNGYSFCALAGKKKIMQLGDIKQRNREKVFLLSSTHGGETIGLAAGNKVIDIYKKKNVIKKYRKIIKTLDFYINKEIISFGLKDYIKVFSSDWRIFLEFYDSKNKISDKFRTLFLQEMIKNNILFQGIFLPCYRHSTSDINLILKGFKNSCYIYKQALKDGINKYLIGKEIKGVFRRYN